MEILITQQCAAIPGSLGRGYGYHIQRRKKSFSTTRNSNGEIPADGHLRFIFACAELAQLKTHITDIRVTCIELSDALSEAGFYHLAALCPVLASSASVYPESEILSATDIINFRRDYLPNPA